MALKSVDDVEGGGFDDELSAAEIAYLAKNFRNFLRNSNRKAKGTNATEPRNFRKHDPTKVNNNDKPFDEFYAKLKDIVNSAFILGEIYNQPKIVRKILRSLIEDFRPKVTVITKSKNVNSIPVDELIGSL